MTDAASAVPQAKVPSLPRVLACATAIFVLDGLVLGQGSVALFVLLWMLFVALPGTLRRKYAGVRGQRLRNIGVYVIAVVLIGACMNINNRIARERADKVVDAVKAFHAAHQRYPERLQELVPAFLPEIPRAKYTWLSGEFHYLPRDGKPLVFYTILPPFGTRAYRFDTGEWTEMD